MPDIEFPTSAEQRIRDTWPCPRASRVQRRSCCRSGGASTRTSARSATALPQEGFFALAPDLYRGETTAQPSEAEQKMMALSMDQAEKDMCGAADYLLALDGVSGPGVGSVGFCLGGGLSVWAAATCPNIAAAVSFYYVMPHGKPDFTASRGLF